MSLMGLDVGTSGCKAGAFSLDGECLGTAYREYATLRPREGWAELDSREVFAKVKEAIAEAARHTRHDPVSALSVSTMGEAMTPVSRDREILGNSILMADLRGAGHADRLARDFGSEAFYAINPNILGPNYSLPKLLWWREQAPELFERAWKFLLYGEFITFMLGGEPLTSFSHANRTLLFDIRREDWSDTLLAWAGIPREKLARPAASGTAAGTLSEAIADELNLPRGVALVTGGHDQCCNSLGAGICAAGQAVCGLGTVECITPTYDRIPAATDMLPLGLNVEHHVLPGLYVSFLYNQSGVLVKWFRDTFAQAERGMTSDGDALYDALMREMPAEPTRLLVLPHFEITGSPSFITDSAGVIAGLRTSTPRGEILKAIIEGATFYFVEGIEALKSLRIDTSEFVATGGGAKSDAWLQIKADIFGVPFIRPKFTECGMLGAAMLAGQATGAFASAQEAVQRFVRRERVFEPDAARHAIYRERYHQYQQVFPALKALLATL